METINAIYYVGNGDDLDTKLKKKCSTYNISLDYEIDFDKLVNRVLASKPDMLIFNLRDYASNKNYLQLFKTDSPLYVPIVFVIGNIEPDYSLNLPSNYTYVIQSEFNDLICMLSNKIKGIQKENEIINNIVGNNNEQIFKCLLDLGFNGSTYGTHFIKECVNEIMINNCKPSVFSTNIYERIAQMFDTTPASIARCIKVAICSAYKKRQNISQVNGASFDDFVECPSAKEFIYYLANKLYNFNINNKFKLHIQNAVC